MNVFAISDLHLPAHQKPMDIFGDHWLNHFEAISQDWREKVADEDVVLLPGDFSWAMSLDEAMDDIRAVAALPGKKLLIRGNHDYWWSAIGRVRRALPENMLALQNDALLLGDTLFAGSRGWTIPTGEGDDENDVRIYERERLRLRLSLEEARRKHASAPIIVMMHYPPLSHTAVGFSDILSEYGVRDCFYGHLHGEGLYGAICGEHGGVFYHQVSCDGLGFRLYRLKDR